MIFATQARNKLVHDAALYAHKLILSALAKDGQLHRFHGKVRIPEQRQRRGDLNGCRRTVARTHRNFAVNEQVGTPQPVSNSSVHKSHADYIIGQLPWTSGGLIKQKYTED